MSSLGAGQVERLEERNVMSKKLFVGSLSWGTDDQGLRTAFERFGDVTDAKVITDRDSGRSRGLTKRGPPPYHEAEGASTAPRGGP